MCWRWSPSLAVAVPPRVRTHHQKRTTRGWQNGRRGRSGRSGFQDAASPSVGKRASRFCGACDTTSCCNGLVSCGSDGRNARRDALLGQHLTDFVPVIPCIAPHAGGVAGDHLCCHRPHGACWSCPPWLRLHAVGWALMSVASIIRTSGSAASDADNSEKIKSKTPLSHQRRQRLSRVLWGPSAAGASTQRRPF